MVLQCYECVLVSSGLYSVIDTQLRCDFFVVCVDVSYGIRMSLFVGLSDFFVLAGRCTLTVPVCKSS